MKLIPDWRRVVVLSISFWMQVVGLVVLIVPEIVFRETGRDTNPVILWWAGVLLLLAGLAGLAGRLVTQTNSAWREHLRMAAVLIIGALMAFVLATRVGAAPPSDSAIIAASTPMIAGHEGERRIAYLPTSDDVPTICFGSTGGVHMGDVATHAECLDLLRVEVRGFWFALKPHFTADTLDRRLPVLRGAAYNDLGYNCGTRAIGRSTSMRRLNAGDVPGACQAMTWWTRQGHRVLRGLVARRKDNYRDCMAGA